MIAMSLDQKYTRLRSILQEMGSALVAFSGGVDSTLLLKVARDVLGDRVEAITIDAPFHSRFEVQESIRLAAAIGVRHSVLDAHGLQIDGLNFNPPDRCYLCKKTVFDICAGKARQAGLAFLLDGSNADDVNDYRPGRRALVELAVRSPLLEAGLNKAEIRGLSRQLGLDTWDKPALACLLTRFPHGEQITAERLAMVEQCEEYLRLQGFGLFRVRAHGDSARIELTESDLASVLRPEVRAGIAAFFHKAGFRFVSLDLDGYRCGAMNPVSEG
jgi:pyridinium-3,5-biscarboxylic acid mononucleotide sulfurtransferase